LAAVTAAHCSRICDASPLWEADGRQGQEAGRGCHGELHAGVISINNKNAIDRAEEYIDARDDELC